MGEQSRVAALRPVDGVHVADLDSELLFLDLATNEYFGAGQALSAAVRWAFDPGSHVCPPNADEQLAPLIRRGFLVPHRDREPYRPATPATPGGALQIGWRPLGGATINEPRPTTLRATVVAVRWLHLAYAVLQRHNARGLINELRQRRKRRTRNVPVESLVEAHIRARMWYPRITLCLDGSAALAMHAWSWGIDVTFVIGVQNRPFFAHSWVEHNGTIINDLPDFKTALAPILTIGADPETLHG